ncbi:hypothetical protein D3C87_1590550 [compost metagenome]
MAHGFGARDIAAPLADHHRQFGFVVDLVGNAYGQVNVGPRPDNRLRHLGKDDGPGFRIGVVVLEHRIAQLFRMRVIVTPNTKEVASLGGKGRFVFHLIPSIGVANRGRQCLAFGQQIHSSQRALRRELAGKIQSGHATAIVGNHSNPTLAFNSKYRDLHACSLGGQTRQTDKPNNTN